MFSTSKNIKPIETLIGEQCTINGTLCGSGNLKIDGNIDGDINWDNDITVEICSTCTGNISCDNIFVFGKINGDIICSHTLCIENMGKVYGNISCGNLLIKEGAYLLGKCTMITEEKTQELSD